MDQSSRIDVAAAKRLLDTGEPVLFLDTRNSQAWAESTVKLPGAQRVPADRVSEYLNKIPKDKQIIAYCT